MRCRFCWIKVTCPHNSINIYIFIYKERERERERERVIERERERKKEKQTDIYIERKRARVGHPRLAPSVCLRAKATDYQPLSNKL